MLQSHVEVQHVGAIAERAGVPKLVLSHIIDFAHGVVDPRQWTEWAGRGYAGEVVVGNDLQRITVR
ncbi:hypothetical protein [Rhodococcus sp. T7]|uniref:hypothetical protein n=1 Tax=Rhodococcus sp. T7 TaxID=627444 RepID=UPI0013C9B147|nr:hypothetical protein [Rhodococcus sp. T7]KAF0960030.1 hypothetical protein MLGJGCBP_06880 [Rhodococcus sp. T7]